jgi:hypothetical protein
MRGTVFKFLEMKQNEANILAQGNKRNFLYNKNVIIYPTMIII